LDCRLRNHFQFSFINNILTSSCDNFDFNLANNYKFILSTSDTMWTCYITIIYIYRTIFVTLTVQFLTELSATLVARSQITDFTLARAYGPRLFDFASRLTLHYREKRKRVIGGRKNRDRVVRKARGGAVCHNFSVEEGEERHRKERRRRKWPPDTEVAQCPAGSAIVLAGLPFPRLYGQRAEFAAVPYV